MEVVRSTLGHQAHHRSRRPAVFGRELIGDQTELLNDFWIVHHLLSPGDTGIVRVLAVNHEAVAANTRAIHREVCARCEYLVPTIELTDSRSRKGKSENVSEPAVAAAWRRQNREVG